MTRPRADSDPWLTDMVSRDKEIAKTVVYGIRTIITLLRDIKDGQAEEARILRQENARLRDDLLEAYRAASSMPPSPREIRRANDVPPCEMAECSLPLGHFDAHRGKIARAVG